MSKCKDLRCYTHLSFLISHSSFLIPHFSFLISYPSPYLVVSLYITRLVKGSAAKNSLLSTETRACWCRSCFLLASLFCNNNLLVELFYKFNSTNRLDIQKIIHYKSAFDQIAKSVKDDDGNNVEVWYARELQQVLGYARWENFVVAIGRAVESCKTLGINVDDHFREVTKMISLAKGAQREVQDFMLTKCQRHAWPTWYQA